MFICAHDEIRNWVEQVILLSLENEYNPPYKICWHLRDFIAGLPINEQIVNAIYNSRKVAIIFSEHFMDSKFCQLELEHALYRQLKSKTRCLLPITLSDELVPPELKRRLTYMVLPDNKHLISKLTKLIGKFNVIVYCFKFYLFVFQCMSITSILLNSEVGLVYIIFIPCNR